MKRTILLFAALSFPTTVAMFSACSSGDNGTPGSPDSGASAEDSGTTQPTDSGTTTDSGSPGVDSGKSSADSGKPATDSGTADTSTPVDSGSPTEDSGMATDTGTTADSGTPSDDAGDSGPCVNLTVDDVKDWCSITINGGNGFSSGSKTVCVTPGSTVTLVAAPNPASTFQLGDWHNTAGDVDGGGDPGSPAGTTTVVVSDTRCVWICCPFQGGSGCIQDPNSACAFPGHS